MTVATDPDVVETVQKLPFRRLATLRLTRVGLSSATPPRTRILHLDRVRSLRLEALRGAAGRPAARLIVLGEEGTLALYPGRMSGPSAGTTSLSAATFVDLCLTRVLAASPAVVLLTGLSQSSYNLWIMTAVLGVVFLIFAVLLVLAGTPLSEVLGGCAILAMLPSCWVNLTTGKPQDVSEPAFRAAIARAFALPTT